MSSTRKNHSFTKSLPYNSNKGCPAGYHHREGYKSSTGTYVPPRCVKSTTRYAESSKSFKARTLKKASQRLRRAGVTPYTANTRKVCPPGQALRRAYVRRYSTAVREKGYTVHRGNKTYKAFPKGDKTVVKAACIEDKGAKGIGPQRIGPLRHGELTKYGYTTRKSANERHNALKKAVKEYGALGVYRKLNAVAKLGKTTAPNASKTFSEDRNWVKETMGPLKAF